MNHCSRCKANVPYLDDVCFVCLHLYRDALAAFGEGLAAAERAKRLAEEHGWVYVEPWLRSGFLPPKWDWCLIRDGVVIAQSDHWRASLEQTDAGTKVSLAREGATAIAFESGYSLEQAQRWCEYVASATDEVFVAAHHAALEG